jgi:hypothetical protein
VRGFRSALLGIALATTGACSDDTVVVDAGPDATDAAEDGAVMVSEPIPPAPPALPEMTPCPDGWQEVGVGATAACEPWPADTTTCAFPEVRFVGEPACASLGPACPASGEWPADLPADGSVIFVREGATGGDGTMSAPLGTLADAIDAAAAGETIALAAGTYAGDVVVPSDVTLRGACVDETEVVGSAGELPDATVVMRPGSTVRDLRIRGERPGLVAAAAGTFTLQNLWISGVDLGAAISNPGVVVDGEGLVVDGLTPGPDNAPVAIYVGSEAIADLRRVQVARIDGTGVGANARGHLTLSDASIFDSLAPEGSAAGVGASALNQGILELHRVLIDGANSAGILLGGQSTADFTDLCVRDIAHTETSSYGSFGVGVTNASIATMARAYVTRTEGSPLVVLGFRSLLTAEDVVVGEVLSTTVEELTGSGVLVDTGAAELTRTYVKDARNSGVTVTGVEGTASLRDLTVIGTERELTNEAGLGLDVNLGGMAVVRRASFEENVAGGAVVSGASSALDLEDVTVLNTEPTDSGRFGRGLGAQGGAALTASRVAIADNVEVGVFIHGAGPEVTLRDVVVERTAISESSGAGNGFVAIESARVDIERFRIADNALAGIQIATGARVVARDGIVSGNLVGVNIQSADVDPADLSDRIIYVDNQQNLDASELPVPAPTR